MAVPRVFVSYSHDSPEHKAWVLDLATKLRHSGVESILDQWALGPGGDLPHFMEQNLASADRVLMICTDPYVKKANAGTGGVGYEKMIITPELMKSIDSRKVIPLIRQSGTKNVPAFLNSKIYLDFSRSDQFEFSFDELVRDLHGAPLYAAPPVAANPFDIANATEPVEAAKRSSDPIISLMRLIVKAFDASHFDWVRYAYIIENSEYSRIMVDMFISDLINKRLVRQDDEKDIWLTDEGRRFAIVNNLTGKR
ncbi:TIR domain-containing protein [Xylophilus rhododendri]|uniref:TIR domain-containing protein n=1 Tax=Xylophilus rhododendri TaxID=2697032 RepID=A0A857J5Q9_9BURK|nr:toll/interleukin-1 receptor domain-containing protein [Xylophilus rhododendri]QHI99334.1 TIR domain-containing protein [Xylophilus rhododendri]